MLLRGIRIENWRCLREPLALRGLGGGLNLIHGPNETGKSTVLDAICRGFFDRHRTAAREMHSRRPWGSDLGPTVQIEFEVGPDRYRLEKRFLSEPQCELKQQRDGKWEKLAQGVNADDRIMALAAGSGAGSGLTKPEHWGLGQVLWASQGDSSHIAIGDSQQARLHEILRLTLDSTQGQRIEQFIHEWYEEVYTPGGRLRGGQNKAEVQRLAEELESAAAEMQLVRDRLGDVDRIARELNDAEEQAAAATRQSEDTQKQLASLRSELERMKDQLLAHEQAASAASQAKTLIDQRTRACANIATADGQVTETEQEVRLADQRVSAATTQFGPASDEADRLAQEREQARRDLAALDERLTAAQGAQRAAEAKTEADLIRRRQSEAVTLQARIREADSQIAGLKAPSQSQLDRLRAIGKKLAVAQVQLDAASLTVEIQPERPMNVTVTADDAPPLRHAVSSPQAFRAASQVAIDVAGVGRVVARAGQSNTAQLVDVLAKIRQEWASATAGLGATELAPLEDLAAKRQVIDERCRQLRQRLQALDVGGREGETRECDPGGSGELLSPGAPGSPDALESPSPAVDVASLRAAVVELQARRAAAQQRLAAADSVATAARERYTTARDALAGARQRLDVALALLAERTRLAEQLRAEYGADDLARARDLADAQKAFDEAQQRLKAVPKPPVQDLAGRIARLEETVRTLTRTVTDRAAQIARLTVQLEQAGGQGLYTMLAEASEKEATLRRKHEQASLEAQAILLLSQTVAQEKSRVFGSVLESVRDLVTRGLRQLIGPRYDQVQFDERLMPARVRPSQRGEDADVDDLSFGTREQLMLLVRLALARLLGRAGERQCVILDDPLVNTDGVRQKAALQFLAEAAREAQIIIFTCHPSSYDGIEDATRFDLRELAGHPTEDADA